MVLDNEKLQELQGKNIYILKSKIITNNQTLLKIYLIINKTLDCKYNYNLIVLIICNLS